MKRKRLLCVLLALLLVLQTGWAAEAGPADSVINVLLPSGGQVVINPYGLAVPAWDGESHEQIVHAPQTLVNLSDFPVIVNAAVTGARPAGSEAVFVPSPPLPDLPGKEVFLYVEFQNQPEWWAGSYSGLPNQLVVSEWGGFQENVLILDAQGEGWFRLFGEVSVSPESPWSDEDVFGAVLTFTFAPLYPELLPVEEIPPEDAETPPEEQPPEETEVPEETVSPEKPENPEVPETPGTPSAGADEVQPVPPEEPAPEEETDVGQDGGEVPEGPDQPEGPAEEDPAAGTEDAVPPES